VEKFFSEEQGFCNTRILQHKDFATQGFCNTRILQHKDFATQGFCNKPMVNMKKGLHDL